MGGNPDDHAEAICRMVRLLGIRTHSLRTKFLNTTIELLDLLEGSIDEPESQDAIQAYLVSEFDSVFQNTWDSLDPLLRSLVPQETLKQTVRAQLTGGNLAPLLAKVSVEARAKVDWKEIGERGQVSGLLKLLESKDAEPVPKGWTQIQWRIVRLDEPRLVLGDCVVLEIGNDTDGYVPFGREVKQPAGFCVPVAPDTLLFGATDGQTAKLDSDYVNKASASLSANAYFAHESSEIMGRHLSVIGSVQGMLDDESILSVAKDSWQNLGNYESAR